MIIKRLAYLVFILLFLVSAQYNYAQEHKDCDTAFNPCGESPFHFDTSQGEGVMDPGVDATCVGTEYNSTWISWTVLQGGTLTFVLTPDSVNQDLDFLVYKFNNGSNCEDKELIRCMASGENVGAPMEGWVSCTGPTGLATGESDTEELPGCSSGDNNFLAPLETNEGDSYVILVNDFSATGDGFTLSFGGDAILDCITVSAKEEAINSDSSFKIVPTLSSGKLFIDLANEGLLGAQLMIYNMVGQPVFSENSIRQMNHFLDLTNLPSGSYTAVLRKEKTIFTKRFIIF